MIDSSDVVGADLRSVAERAAQQNAERSAVAGKRHREEREARVEDAARKFLADRTEHLPDLLQQAAEKGLFEFEVCQRELGHLPHGGEEIESIKRGMRYVADWLKERGIGADLYDNGGESIPDYGFTHIVRLMARWK